ncbi:hypothetical protein [Compostibacter hankyongensis]|uniref:Uncharacterized protein n=1 Tax=Compostibacter hankyongensis TaxID=1007089 RepID=A0ABP8FGB8_9BACT
MQIKYNQHTLDRVEKIFEESGYILRYEKGTFNSGYCLLEHKKVVVVNKFLSIEGRIGVLADILPALSITADHLPEGSRKLYEQLLKQLAEAPLQQTGTGDAPSSSGDPGANNS